MNFSEYQKLSRLTAQYPDAGRNITYPTIGLAGETGEVAEKVKKAIRDHGGRFTEEMRDGVAKELGDVLWYMSQIATELGLSLERIAAQNITKLLSRKLRGKISGDGDNR